MSKRQPHRQCSGCHECCTIYAIPEYDSPYGEPCRHVCEAGCAIHDQERPLICTGFECEWVRDRSRFPEYMRPDTSGIVFHLRLVANGVRVYSCVMRTRYPEAMVPKLESLLRRAMAALHKSGYGVDSEKVAALIVVDSARPDEVPSFCPCRRIHDDIDYKYEVYIDEERPTIEATDRHGHTLESVAVEVGGGA
jgi:hypothetical protein